MKSLSEQERLEQRFVGRTRALTLLRLSLLLVAQVFTFDLSWAVIVTVGVCLSYLFAKHKTLGRIIVFSSLLLDLAWIGVAISLTGVFTSPLLAALPAMTLVFAIPFHKPFVLLPPLLLLPALTFLQPEVPLEIIALISLLNACTIYLSNKILGDEERMSTRLIKLEQELKEQAVFRERHRLSRDIHDGVGSTISSLVLEAEMSGNTEVASLARQALQETRYAISVMRDDFEIAEQIKQITSQFHRRYQIPVKLNIFSDLSKIENAKAISIVRIIQESLNNIAKHASASSIDLDIGFKDGKLALSIKDNGVGFNPSYIPEHHYGLSNIKSRVLEMGGTLNIQSEPHLGTHIQIGASA
jgi:signal transduction histidine kinase